MPHTPLLELSSISKVFNGQPALSAVNLSLMPGEIHALVGENGAGKSTLIKVITGVYPPTEGELRWQGRPLSVSSPLQAQQLGIRVLHQERQLIPSFTALENLYVGSPYPLRRGVIDWPSMRREARSLLASLGWELPLDEIARHLTPTQRTLTELLRAVHVKSNLLILDEPTASLTVEDAGRLFELIHSLRSAGTAVLYVSHRLEEVLRLADVISVMRGGAVTAQFVPGDVDAEALVGAMSGESRATSGPVSAPSQSAQAQPAETVLRVRQLVSCDGRVAGVSFELQRGEILGVYGLAGSGRTELLETIAGHRQRASGSVEFPTGLAANAVLIPEDRRGQGLIGHMSVAENMTLSTLPKHTRFGIIQAGSEKKSVQEATARLQIRCEGLSQRVTELSGGNQQKVVFARALAGQPGVWLCDEPTQAVDVMTRRAIHDLLRAQAQAGAGIVFVTSDLDELLEIADQVLVIRDGQSVATLAGERLTSAGVLSACYGGTPAGRENQGGPDDQAAS